MLFVVALHFVRERGRCGDDVKAKKYQDLNRLFGIFILIKNRFYDEITL